MESMTYPLAVFGEAATGNAAITMALGDDWDVAVVDISMPGTNGIGVLKAIKAAKAALPVIMTARFASPAAATYCTKAGASAYIAEQIAPDELPAAVRAVLA
jgi:DNA-binding NarL/FixJ family response regulator